MILPPLTMWLSVEQPAHRTVRLWLPLFLVWLLLLPLALLALVTTLVVDTALLLAGERYHHYTLLLVGSYEVLAESRGTVVRVRATNAVVDLTIA